MAKFCKKCGKELEDSVVFCPYCGTNQESGQTVSNAQPQQQASPIIVNVENSNNNTNQNVSPEAFGRKRVNKWVAFLLCWFLGFLGAHKFYEGRIGMGIVYIFTCGLFGIGAFIDFWAILFKPNPYYV